MMEELFFWVSKLAWIFIAPDSLLLLWFGVGLFFLWKGRVVWAKKILGYLLLILIVVGLFPVGDWLFYPLETKFPHNPELKEIDGIIVLSGALNPVSSTIWGQVVSNGAAERNFYFISLARRFPNARLVYTGGTGSMIDQDHKAADVAKLFFAEQGVELSRITFERESRNTWENGLFTKRLIDPKLGDKWVLITTAWHMPRAIGVFCKVGWDVIPYPVDYKTTPGYLFRINWGLASHLRDLVIGVKAWIGQITYQLTGKSC